MKDVVRPIYYELQGHLMQAPPAASNLIFESEIWNQHNQTLSELENVTGKNYERFKCVPKSIEWNGTMRTVIYAQAYRTILGGLIMRLYGEFFYEEEQPKIS